MEEGWQRRVIRLLAFVEFMTRHGWGRREVAILDTGAPMSLLPESIWKGSLVDIKAFSELRGVVPKKECSMPVRVGVVKIRLVDQANSLGPMYVSAYLASTDAVPLIIGFEEVLTELDVRFNYKAREASVGL
ncbi:MAG: hypothetical protein ACUVV0_13670 [Anaerolineae bacterium]